jgi:shikimate 5-dehydrogenase
MPSAEQLAQAEEEVRKMGQHIARLSAGSSPRAISSHDDDDSQPDGSVADRDMATLAQLRGAYETLREQAEMLRFEVEVERYAPRVRLIANTLPVTMETAALFLVALIIRDAIAGRESPQRTHEEA